MGSEYDWSFNTTAQTNAGGRVLKWPRGKVLGGSSAVNGIYAVRPSKAEYDAWVGLLENADGANAWDWDNQFASYKKSEKFTAPDSSLASQFNLLYNTDSQGTDGPINVAWPGL